MASSLVIAERIGLDRRQVRDLLPRFASAAIVADHFALRAFEQAAAKAPLQLLWYADISAYDETPMVTRTDAVVFDIAVRADHSIQALQDGSAQRPVSIRKTILGSDSGPSKLFQTSAQVAMLLKQQEVHEGGASKYLFVTGRPLTCIQLLETSSAEILKAALQASSSVSVAANAFQFKVRVATSDRLAANLKAERQLSLDRGADWLALQSPCDVHCVSGARTKTFALLDGFISLMVNLSLSLRLSGNMIRFRACVRGVVASRLKIMRGEPSPAALAYRLHMLQLFLSRGSGAARRRSMLWVWLNGDWRDESCIRHYEDPRRSRAQNKAEVICRMVTRAVIGALAHRAPAVFPRHRWTGVDLALDEMGLLLGCHGLLRYAYLAFLVACGHKAARQLLDGSVLRLGVHENTEPLAVALEDDEDEEGEVDVPGPEEAGGDADAQAGNPAVAPSGIEEGQSVDWQKLNAKFRGEGSKFVARRPLGTVMLLRICVEPLREMMAAHLHMASDGWEDVQREKQAAFDSGSPGAQPREFRVVIAASCALETKCVQQLGRLLSNASIWQHLPQGSLTVKVRALSFRLLSRIGRSVQELLATPHSQFPFKLFLLLLDDSLAEVFAEAQPCEVDAFSAGILEQYRGVGLGHPDCIMILRSLASVWKVDISQIEAKHASLRRLLKSQVQTKVMSAAGLSAIWVGHLLAKRQLRSGRLGVCKPHLKMKTEPKSTNVRKQKRSAWQYYVHLTAKGRRADFKALGQSYSQLSTGRLAELREKARAACSISGKGKSVRQNPFKDPWRAALSSATRRRRVAQWLRRRKGLPDGQRLEAILSEAFATDPSADQAIRAAGAEARFEQSRALEQSRATSASLLAFQLSDAGKRASETLASTGALLPGSEEHFAPFSFPDAAAFGFAPDIAVVAERVLSASRQPGLRQNLSGALSLDWVRRTQTISQSGLEPIPDRPKEDKKSDKCRIAGHCLCSGEGRDLLRFANEFLYAMKPHFKIQTPGRKLLQDGLIVVALDFAPVPAGGRAAARELPLPDFLLPVGSGRLWLHIGLHYFKPYRPTFQVLHSSAAEPSVPGSIALRAQGGFKTMYAVFAEVDHKSLCSMAFFRLWESDQPLGQFVPAEMSVLPFSDPELFWYGPFAALGHVGSRLLMTTVEAPQQMTCWL